MHLLLRLLLILWRLRHRAPTPPDPLAGTVLHLRVLPTDLDLNLHMNNARYLGFMDLGRVDLLGRLGLLGFAFRGRWIPVLGAVRIQYLRPLHLGQRFELATRFLGWDDRWFYLEQRFTCENRLVATAQVRALLRGPEGSIPSTTVLAGLGISRSSPALPDSVRSLQD